MAATDICGWENDDRKRLIRFVFVINVLRRHIPHEAPIKLSK